MSQFRPALESFVDGRTDLSALESQLRSDLTREPAQAQVLSELIETTYRDGRINGPAYLALVDVVRSTVLPGSGDKQVVEDVTSHSAETRLAPRHSDEDATRYRPAPTAPPAKVTGSNTFGSSTGGSTQHWAAGQSSREPQPGDVIKERFVLEDIIGKGGMGVVFRARDLRKEEAQDRHPHVALKVLNENFKRHPESLKALQREARKAQNLAHPNIVTVYDFDRDGANVYMVMELLEGEPLDRYIKRLNGHGLNIHKAMPFIRALCGALGYAHEHGVVHSDFKGANAFVSRNGTVKVFDFGIARAAKPPEGEDHTTTKTLFDPGTLGALTPSYASCEMLEGLEPDPRDDIYALGCVVYELLTGGHPFGSKPATFAREAKLKAKPIQGLTSRQWRALRRALAFDRESRIATVPKFLEEMTPEPRATGQWIAIGVATAALAAAAVYFGPSYLQRRNANALAATIRSGEPAAIEQALPKLEALAPDLRATMLLDEEVRNALIKDFSDRIDAATDSSQQRYDYPFATDLFERLTLLLPDSQAVARIGEQLTTRKNDEIKRLSDRFDQYLQQGRLVAAQHSDNVSAVIGIVEQIDPQHPLLADPRLPSAYAEQAQEALQAIDAELAALLVTAGLSVAPNDSTLKDLQDRVGREVENQRRAARLADLRRKLTDDALSTTTLAEFDAMQADLLVLQSQASQDAVVSRAQRRLQQLVDGQVQSLVAQSSFDNAHELLARYAILMTPQFIESKRAALIDARSKSGATSSPQYDAAVAALKSELDALLKMPDSADEWDARIGAQLAKLSAYLAPADAYLSNAKNAAAESHLATAIELRLQGRLSEAERVLQRARTYTPGLAAIAQETQQLALVRAEQDARDKEEKRIARLAALRQKLLDQAKANEVTEAAASLRELRDNLPSTDAFVSTTAPQVIASAYVRLAAISARDGNPGAAVTLIDRALELDRSNAQTVSLREQYAKQAGTPSAATQSIAQSPTTQSSNQNGTAARVEPAPNATAPASAGTAASQIPAPAKSEPIQVASAPQVATQPATSQQSTGTACTAALAGYGTRSRGICYDALPSGRGPELVVVPAGASMAKPFAISRFEISAADYAEFCKQSGKCQAGSAQADLPLTGISIADATSYVEWLSAATGFAYRLPTDAEWTHVAGAPGGSAERDFNCVVEINGQQIRGFALGSVRQGKANGWGLYNLVGNAQEWVKTADGWSARGGAFNDPISQCSPSLSRSTAGAASPNTGFRVLRELR